MKSATFSLLDTLLTASWLLIRLQLHGAIYRPDSFAFMLRYCANLKAIRYESTSLNRIAADKSHHVIAALNILLTLKVLQARTSGHKGAVEIKIMLDLNKYKEWTSLMYAILNCGNKFTL